MERGAEPLRETIRKKVVVAAEIAATAAAEKAAAAGNASAAMMKFREVLKVQKDRQVARGSHKYKVFL